MQANFLKITLRKLVRNRIYTSISILGLALGISSCLFIAMYVMDELSFDHHHEKKDRIVRLTNILNFNGATNTALTDLPSGPAIVNEFPEVENFVRFRGTGRNGAELSYKDRVINVNNVWFVDSTVFDVFTYTWLNGDPATALTAPKSIVLTASTAQQFFGATDPIGKTLKINNSFLTVQGVIANTPANSEVPINALISLTTLPPQMHQTFNQDWFRIGFYTYLLFKDQPDIRAFEEKMVAFEKKYVQPWAEANQIEAGLQYFATPLSKVHFDGGKQFDLPKGNKNYIYIFSLLAVFILIIASINYINLSLAQGSKRAKEVGVRKTLGAHRKELVSHFIAESVLITLIATVIGLALVELWLGTFNQVTGKALTTSVLFSLNNGIVLLAIIAAVGILASSYPAMVLSAYEPVKVLKGVLPQEKGVGHIRKLLIFIQFLFSIFMITGTLLIDEQMSFIRSKDLGFDREHLLSISVPADTSVSKQVPVWVEQLRNDSRIQSVSMTNMPSGQTGRLMFRIEKEGQLKEQTLHYLFVDEYFLEVLGVELITGRNFDKNRNTDTRQAFIINEHAARTFGWTNEALGKRVQWGLMANNQASNDGKVIGVIKDFNFLSLHNPMEPIVLCFNPAGSNTLSIRLAAGDYTPVIKALEKHWNEIAPKHPFNYTFMEDILDRNYRQEQAMSDLFNYFAVIALLIASLGLFALVSFTIQGRVKEIGIRKVLGASLPQLAWLLMKDFFYLLVLAFLVTVPVNLYLNNRWLESFAFDAPFNPINYVIAFLVSVVLALATIAYHIFKVAQSDPVQALHYE